MAANQQTSVLDEIYEFLGRFVAYPSDDAHVAHTLWIAHAHLMKEWESTPRIAFLSPEPGSGKTRALEVTETLVPNPVETINSSPAYIFRRIGADPTSLPTILHDEIDTIFGDKAREHEDMRAIINAGHRRGATAGRCVVRGKTVETEEFPAFCAVAMAGLGNLPDTILTRSVVIKMRRRAPTEIVEPYRRRLHAPEGHRLRERLAQWAKDVTPILNTMPIMPEGIEDRNADVWEALLSLADAAGGDWPDRARVAAVALVADAAGERGSLGVRLLKDIRTVIGERDGMWTDELLAGLCVLEESPWGDLNGKPINDRRLADFLRPYGVRPGQVKLTGTNKRGYTRGAFHDAWARYLTVDRDPSLPPAWGATSATTVTDEQVINVD